MNKEKLKISVRLDDEATEIAKQLMEETGSQMTQIVNQLFKNISFRQIKDGRKVAMFLCEIQNLLKQNNYSEKVEEKILATCDLLIEEIYELFQEGDKKTDGDFESN